MTETLLTGLLKGNKMDFSAITAAVDVSTVAAAIIAMAAIKIVPNVARWAGNKLANFF